MGLYRDNEKENGNYYTGECGYTGILEKKMEATKMGSDIGFRMV